MIWAFLLGACLGQLAAGFRIPIAYKDRFRLSLVGSLSGGVHRSSRRFALDEKTAVLDVDVVAGEQASDKPPAAPQEEKPRAKGPAPPARKPGVFARLRSFVSRDRRGGASREDTMSSQDTAGVLDKASDAPVVGGLIASAVTATKTGVEIAKEDKQDYEPQSSVANDTELLRPRLNDSGATVDAPSADNETSEMVGIAVSGESAAPPVEPTEQETTQAPSLTEATPAQQTPTLQPSAAPLSASLPPEERAPVLQTEQPVPEVEPQTTSLPAPVVVREGREKEAVTAPPPVASTAPPPRKEEVVPQEGPTAEEIVSAVTSIVGSIGSKVKSSVSQAIQEGASPKKPPSQPSPALKALLEARDTPSPGTTPPPAQKEQEGPLSLLSLPRAATKAAPTDRPVTKVPQPSGFNFTAVLGPLDKMLKQQPPSAPGTKAPPTAPPSRKTAAVTPTPPGKESQKGAGSAFPGFSLPSGLSIPRLPAAVKQDTAAPPKPKASKPATPKPTAAPPKGDQPSAGSVLSALFGLSPSKRPVRGGRAIPLRLNGMDGSFFESAVSLLNNDAAKIRTFQQITDSFRSNQMSADRFSARVKELFGSNYGKIIEPLMRQLPEPAKRKQLELAYNKARKSTDRAAKLQPPQQQQFNLTALFSPILSPASRALAPKPPAARAASPSVPRAPPPPPPKRAAVRPPSAATRPISPPPVSLLPSSLSLPGSKAAAVGSATTVDQLLDVGLKESQKSLVRARLTQYARGGGTAKGFAEVLRTAYSDVPGSTRRSAIRQFSKLESLSPAKRQALEQAIAALKGI
ncbi:unnamed protein product [Vitrella brassicaformis CCMP3155]|uniref:ZNF598/HEL2 PAH domain-containing protein n=2 Tax=Vitrella brassicaformis TaxID=1169539 RepID=A0A0G4E9N5_VITBC|nr:unnamed protein product [Vitrella brassicaformis CCMP3155]|mmetsp:Transcript_20405/g.49632  ORF Transcript_20405/g.49632 Transcript_20405/m.49632 type:complete len:803 (+) Transcript_20405:214-2622(+)|eukprot:CEL92356.1 unnamed protein product [Vitrella brassicaformis CCMP3155]